MAGEKHLKYFCVENFKRFERLELDNIGQFNLIGGDNNVGKTTLLEALLVEEENLRQTIFNLNVALKIRKIELNSKLYKWIIDLYQSQRSIFGPNTFFIKKSDSALHKYALFYRTIDSLTLEEANSLQAQLAINQGLKEVLELNSDGLVTLDVPSMAEARVPIVAVNTGYSEGIVDAYSSNIQVSISEEEALLENFRLFVPDAIGLGISNSGLPDKQNVIFVRLKGQDKPLPLPMFGEGAIKLFRILVAIVSCKGKRLMVDEIDIGIHHSRFESFWRTILKSAKKNDVQLFATTHNRECLKFLKETLEEPDMKEFQVGTRYFLLHEQPDKAIKAIGYSFPQFQFAIDNDNELRS